MTMITDVAITDMDLANLDNCDNSNFSGLDNSLNTHNRQFVEYSFKLS